MPPNRMNASDLRQMLAYIAETMAREEAYLTSLDSAIGDGDHGITMRLGFQAIREKVNGLEEGAGVDAILREAGFAFMGATGGAIGVLLGKMLMAAGAALRGKQEIGGAELRPLLSSMETALVAAGKAKPGDKTLLDAVHAANEALVGEVQPDLLSALTKASEGACRGAESTAQMPARIGRSSRLGDRALGNPDPGATSFAIILRAMTAWLQKQSPSAD
ncbi:MAG TPA: dihydroxyacetone kinase subunit DhaL [Terriglobia bacterium]|nr:dihydroxyacetone kinase subunit DhaL [Terriglobia bacterium]